MKLNMPNIFYYLFICILYWKKTFIKLLPICLFKLVFTHIFTTSILCCAVQCSAVQCSAVQCSDVQSSAL